MYSLSEFIRIVPIDLGNGVIHNLKYEKIHIKESPEIVMGNICSFFGITTEILNNDGTLKIDEEMKKFGSCVILIYNYPKFLKMLHTAIEKVRIDYYYGLVEYYDESTYSGKLSPYHKRNKYEYQREFRIYLKTELTTSYTLNLGSLKGIAMIGKANDIEKLKIFPMTFKSWLAAIIAKIKASF